MAAASKGLLDLIDHLTTDKQLTKEAITTWAKKIESCARLVVTRDRTENSHNFVERKDIWKIRAIAYSSGINELRTKSWKTEKLCHDLEVEFCSNASFEIRIDQ